MNLLELLGLSAANALPFTATEKKAKQNVEKLKGCDWFNQLYENEIYNELFNHSEVIKVILTSVEAEEILQDKEAEKRFNKLLVNKLEEQKNTPV